MRKQDTVLITPALWDAAMEKIRERIGLEAFDAWIEPLVLEDFDDQDQCLLLSVPNRFYRRWIEKRYHADLCEIFSELAGTNVGIRIEISGESTDDGPDGTAEEETDLFPTREFPGQRDNRRRSNGTAETIEDTFRHQIPSIVKSSPAPRREPAQTPRLNPRYLFDEFVVGESNRYAHAAAVAVADPNGKAFNPLFIYGGSGLGKTHLMHAIGHRAYENDTSLNILYVNSEQFINGFIDAIQNKKHVEFRQSYRNVDILLIDDVQFLTGKERTQQEFFHTFNALYDAGKKIIVTSDRPPKDLSALEDRLRSRFEWGLLVDIQSPDLETRIAILRKKARQEGVALPNDVIVFIAERITENVREMEGALKRLRMAASLHDQPIDMEMARDVLGHLMVGSPQPRVTIDDVQRAVCAYFSIRVTDLLGKNRSKKFSQPRHLAQYLCRQLTDLSFPDIAQKFGGKDHTSIIYACRKVDTAIKKDANLQGVVNYLTKQITKGQ